MEKLKKSLFNDCLVSRNTYLKLAKDLGELHKLTCCEFTKFSALYSLIEESGLEMEYYNWCNSIRDNIPQK